MRHYYLMIAILLSCFSYGQGTVVTSPPLINNNGQSGVTFEVESAVPIIITQVANIFNNGSINANLWMRTGGVQHSPGAAPNITAANGWTQVISNVTVAGNGSTPVPYPGGPYSFAIPANTPVGFFIEGGTGYQTHAGPPDVFTDGTLIIRTGTNAGYGGGAPNPTFHPRQFLGTVTYILAGPCTSPPIAGNTAATDTTICLGNMTRVSVTGGTAGMGQSYQWQQSVDNITWSNMFNDTLLAADVQPSGSTYYRCIVTCSGVSDTTSPLLVNVIGTPLAAGTYTINSGMPTQGNNFNSFNAFFTSIVCGGISGPIVLNVVPGSGPYNEHVLAGPIGGSSATNTITINGNNEVLQFAVMNNNQRAVLTFEGASNIRLNDLTIRPLASGTYGYGIHMRNGANNNIINNCIIDIDQSLTSTFFSGVVLGSGASPTTLAPNYPFNNTISNSEIYGGYYGITLLGANAADRATGNKLLNNRIHDFHFYGIYSAAQEDYEMIGNNIARPNRANLTSFYGIFFTQQHLGGIISKNQIHTPFGQGRNISVMYPFYSTNSSGTAAKPNRVFNNKLYNLNNDGTLYGIWNATSDHWHYYHNTVDVDDPAVSAGLTYLIYFSGTSNGVEFINNMVSMRRGGTSVKYAMYVVGSGSRTINRNGYFVDYSVGNSSFGFAPAAHATFPAWQTGNGNGWDANSVFAAPNYLVPQAGIMVPTNALLDNIGQNLLSVVPTDFLDSARSTTPDPGAYEFDPNAGCSGASVASINANPRIVCLGYPTNLEASGFSIGVGTQYQWQASTDSLNWTDLIGDTLITATTIVMDTTWYRMRIVCGTDTAYSPAERVDRIGVPLPGGTYTINSLAGTSGTNFSSFTAFFNTINCGGISGPVILNVVPGTGPYIEKVLASRIGGASPINTLTINGNGEVLEFGNTDNVDRGIFTLDGASYVTVNGLIIRALNTGTLGYGVHMRNGAHNNVIKNCQIEIPLNQTGINWAGVVLGSGASPTAAAGNFPYENTIDSNTITGGYYGVTIIGSGSGGGLIIRNNGSGNATLTGGSTPTSAVGNTLTNNIIHDFHFYGLFSNSQQLFDYSRNDFARPNRTNLTTFYGMYFVQAHAGGIISNNAIHSPLPTRTTNVMYPFFASSAHADSANPTYAFNNIMYNFQGDGTFYGIYITNSDHWKLYHNSIEINDLFPTAALTRMVWLANSAHTDFVNNVVFMRRSGTSAKHAIYVTGNGPNNINNNGYFVDHLNGTSDFGYLGTTTFPSWTAWRAGTSFDNASVFDNPNFVFAPGGLLIPNAGSYDNIGQNLTAIVPTDFQDSIRSTTPDPGAFEFQGPACSNPVGFDTMAITSTTIQLTWNQPGAVTEWDIEWGPVGFTPGTTGGNLITTTNNPYTITQLSPGNCYDVYIRANCTNLNLGIGAWVGPVTTCLPWTFDLSIEDLTSPNVPTGCGNTAMPVTAVIFNNGETPVAGVQLHAVLSGDIAATLNTTYAGPLASGATDTVVIGTVNASAGGYTDILIYHAWAQDQNSINDSMAVDSVLILPEVPQQLPSFACSNDDSVTIAMQPFPGVAYLWYDQATAGNLINTGTNFRVPTSAPGPYFVEYQSGKRDSLFTMNQGGSGCGAGNMFDLIPQRLLSITGFDIRPFSSNANLPVSVFMVTGSHLSLTGQAGWTLVAQGTVNATVNVLTRFNLPNPVMLQPNQTYGFYVQFDASYTVGANNFSNADLQFISGNGNCSPFDYCCTPRTFNGAIHYEISGCVSQRAPVQATVYQDTAVADFSFNQTGPGDFSFDGSNSTGHRFEWFFGDGNNSTGMSTSHSYVSSGTYTVTLVVTDTVCNTVDSMQVTVTSTVSLEEFLILQSLRVFPNPSRGVFNIEFEMEGTRDLNLRLLSPTGQLIMQEHNGRTGGIYRKTIDIGGLSKGVYILQVQTENGIISRRLTLM
jgi:hypothetical protein